MSNTISHSLEMQSSRFDNQMHLFPRCSNGNENNKEVKFSRLHDNLLKKKRKKKNRERERNNLRQKLTS